MTKHTEQLIGILSAAELNRCIEFVGVKIVPELAYDGCSGCILETEDKANGCNYKCVCMAHLRRDRKSIVFTSKAE